MKKIILGLVISGLILGGCSSKMDQFVEPQGTPRPSIEPLPTDASFAGEEWYDQMEVWQLHREPARAALMPYPSSQQALLAETSALDETMPPRLRGFSRSMAAGRFTMPPNRRTV